METTNNNFFTCLDSSYKSLGLQNDKNCIKTYEELLIKIFVVNNYIKS